MMPLELLQKLDLVDWSLLLTGFQKGWVTKCDISDYAVSQMSKTQKMCGENEAILAFANSLSDSEVKTLLAEVGGGIHSQESIEKWRFSMLVLLEISSLSDAEKIEKLQEIYADFDYPEDMEECGVYSQTSVGPLVAMSKVISELKGKFDKSDED